MAECYARFLGDCAGGIEDEHFVPQVLQRMFGHVSIQGMAWQRRGNVTPKLPPGAYAHSRILCRKHHDDLDGLDANAAAYFRNLMLMAGGHHLANGRAGRSTDITPTIDGRALERWFLKFMCGAIVTGSIDPARTVPKTWVTALFGRTEWPEQWALYFATGLRRVEQADAHLHVEFHWAETMLNGLFVRFMNMESLFGLETPDRAGGLLRRPIMLGIEAQRDHGGPALEDLGPGDHIRFELSWPD